MRLLSFSRWLPAGVTGSAVALVAAAPVLLGQQEPPPRPGGDRADIEARQGAGEDEDVVDLEVLMRGPVHEGFAEPAVEGPETLELPEPVPDPIEEEPAIARPIDDRREAMWIPGYWGVEGDDELVWVSGSWRFAPPNMRWVPGYWASTDSGSVWVSGFWLDESVERLRYLPAPPPVRETAYDPPSNRPGEEYFWVPGHYVWDDGRYAWEEGFWAEAHPNWTWIPAHYVRTPRGYVFVPGYWDYPPERRGTLFAPVRVAHDYRRVYRPSITIDIRRSMVHWFVYPNYRHYYFGNYYDNRFRQRGFVPWVAYMDRPSYYDPIYTYYNVTRTDFLRTLVQTRQRITIRQDVRLPVTYREYRQFAAERTDQSTQFGFQDLARPVNQVLTAAADGQFEDLREELGGDVRDRDGGDRRARLGRFGDQIRGLRDFAQGRREAEAEGADQIRTDRPDPSARPDRERPEADRRPDDRRPDRDRRPADGDRRPDTDRPDAERPDADRPDADRPDADRPDRPDTERPDADRRPDSGRRQADDRRPGAERPPDAERRPDASDRAADGEQRGDAPSDRGEARRRVQRPEIPAGDDEAASDARQPSRGDFDMRRFSPQRRSPAARGDVGRERLEGDRPQTGRERGDAARGIEDAIRGRQPSGEDAGRRDATRSAPGARERSGFDPPPMPSRSGRGQRRPDARQPGGDAGQAAPDRGGAARSPEARSPEARTPGARASRGDDRESGDAGRSPGRGAARGGGQRGGGERGGGERGGGERGGGERGGGQRGGGPPSASPGGGDAEPGGGAAPSRGGGGDGDGDDDD